MIDPVELETTKEIIGNLSDWEKWDIGRVFLRIVSGEHIQRKDDSLDNILRKLHRKDDDFEFQPVRDRILIYRKSSIRRQEEVYGINELAARMSGVDITTTVGLSPFFNEDPVNMVAGAFFGIPFCCAERFSDWIAERSYLAEEVARYTEHVPCWAYCDRSIEIAKGSRQVVEELRIDGKFRSGPKFTQLYVKTDFKQLEDMEKTWNLCEAIRKKIGKGKKMDRAIMPDPAGNYIVVIHYIEPKDRPNPENITALRVMVEGIKGLPGIDAIYSYAGIYENPTEHNPRIIPHDTNSIFKKPADIEVRAEK